MKYWINVVSHEHVKKGFAERINGKKSSLVRLKKEDHCSLRVSLDSKVKCQKFTSIGEVANDKVYQYDMGLGFIPFRRKVNYIKKFQEVPIETISTTKFYSRT